MRSTRPSEATGVPQGSVLFDVWLVNHVATTVLEDALHDLGFSADEFGLCSLIYYYGPLTPSQIVRWSGLAPTTASTMIKRLTSRGYLDREINPDDARSRLLSISKQGQEVEEQALDILADVLVRLDQDLPDEPLVRTGLESLDRALRELTGLDARPYTYASPNETAEGGNPEGPTAVTYQGDPLTAQERNEVRRYIDWVRARRDPSTKRT